VYDRLVEEETDPYKYTTYKSLYCGKDKEELALEMKEVTAAGKTCYAEA
jgi:hypothetical protein